ncbi:DUF2312 domain-containing protein [Hirschia litorea]|uniref:DUF2312 domain-containing protein n=1 Tax=Hirschia litorea TaxID=1199156 RepID=A0ABW2INL3_9PROT
MDEEDNVIGAMGSMDPTTRDKLRQSIEKVERLEIEKKEVAEQIKEVFAEAKAFGFDPKAMKEVIKHRKMDPDKREEEELVLGTYLAALGEI